MCPQITYWSTEWAKPIVIMDNFINWLLWSNSSRLTSLFYTWCVHLAHLLIVLIQLMVSVWLCSKVITLSVIETDYWLSIIYWWFSKVPIGISILPIFYQYLPISLSYRYDYPHNNNLLDIFKRDYQLLMYRLIKLFVAPKCPCLVWIKWKWLQLYSTMIYQASRYLMNH